MAYDPQNHFKQSAAARIVRGLALGGAKGAILETGVQLAPNLLKYCAALVLFVLFLPIVIFLALPSCLFGMPSVDNTDIQALTADAQAVGNDYAAVQRKLEERADALLQQESEGYDDVDVQRDLQGIDGYWMAAIASVAYNQDLSAIRSGGMDKILARAVHSQSRSETITQPEQIVVMLPDGRTETRTQLVERKLLHIQLRALGPQELMNALGFDAQQRQWAAYLHSIIADDQTQPGVPSVDLGDVTFSDASTPVVFYAQTDARWSGIPYSGSTIGVAGCGPTAVAMVVSSLKGQTVTPDQVAAWSESTGHACYGNGSYHSLIPDALAHYGVSVQTAGSSSASQLADALAQGKLVVVIMGPGTFTNSGHFMVLRGITSDGQVLIADSISYANSQRAWDLSLIMAQAKHSAGAGGPFWIAG